MNTKPRQSGSGARTVRFALIVIFLVAIGVTAASFLPDALSSPNDVTTLIHTIARGDLRVTVTEQGTLESSNNTEIKCRVRGFSTVTYVVPSGTEVRGPLVRLNDAPWWLPQVSPVFRIAQENLDFWPFAGDVLVRLDTKVIEEQFSLTKTNTFIAEATRAQSQANVKKAEIAIDAYREGRYRSQMQSLQKQLEAKKRNLGMARMMLERSEKLFSQGYVTELEVEGNAFTVTQAELELKVKETEIRVLRDFTKEMELVSMNGNLTAGQSKLAADEAGLAMEMKRRDRAREELGYCVVRAEKDGLVIYPSAAAWKRTPDITEGATVRKDQVLLLMPDLDQMQVKVGIHESVIDLVRPGLNAVVTLPDRTLEARVTSVASVTRPAGWWTGNVVKYDTIIELPPGEGLKPGMSAEVEVVMAVHEDVLMIPVAAVVETDEGAFCWVRNVERHERRLLKLGDSNDVFIVVKAGLNEGEQVILNPTAVVDDALTDVPDAPGESKSTSEKE